MLGPYLYVQSWPELANARECEKVYSSLVLRLTKLLKQIERERARERQREIYLNKLLDTCWCHEFLTLTGAQLPLEHDYKRDGDAILQMIKMRSSIMQI